MTSLNNSLIMAKLCPLLSAFPELKIIFVTDHKGIALDRVSYVTPWKFLTRYNVTRLISRFFLALLHAMRPKVKRIMVYNALPHMLICLIPSLLTRKPMDLHMIAGRRDLRFAETPTWMLNRFVRRLRNPVWLQKLTQFIAFHYIDRFFVPGNLTRSWLIEQKVSEGKITSLHSSIDTNRYCPDTLSRDIDVLIVAHLLPRKNPELTIQILRTLAQSRQSLKFVWIGDFHQRHDLLNLMRTNIGQDMLKYLGYQEDILPYYRRAKVFLLNSLQEGLSCACLEAMACGCVPVVADVGDMSEAVESYKTGVLIQEAGNAQVYATSILTVLDSPELRLQMSTASQQMIKQRHSQEVAIEKWKKLAAL